jgi:opacity protein-like surface antigen
LGLAQQSISDKNNIGWYTTTGTIKFAPKWSAHLEYQWRRDNYITNWQQSLLRTGINYQLHENVIVRLGYAWIETFPYGDYPINKFGKQFTEHRTYQVITTSQKIGRFDLSNRYMIEQRWLATYSNARSTDPDKWTYLNRIRYMGRIQTALKGKAITYKTPYAAIYDEIMIGFGQKVGQNIFDQNRLGLLLGYRFNKQFRIEGGYFNQILQLGYRESFTGKNIYQFNTGFIINTFWNL